LSTVVACGFELSSSTSNYLSTASLAGSTIFFPRQKLIDGEWLRMTGEMTGKLVLVNGCLRVAPSNEGDSYLVVWGPSYSLSVENETIQIHDGAGRIVARVGEEMYMGGGRAPTLNYPSVDRGLEKELPPECPGPYFIAGDVIVPGSPAEETE
jgi:hypothetical protein